MELFIAVLEEDDDNDELESEDIKPPENKSTVAVEVAIVRDVHRTARFKRKKPSSVSPKYGLVVSINQ